MWAWHSSSWHHSSSAAFRVSEASRGPKTGPRPIYTQIKLSIHEACYREWLSVFPVECDDSNLFSTFYTSSSHSLHLWHLWDVMIDDSVHSAEFMSCLVMSCNAVCNAVSKAATVQRSWSTKTYEQCCMIKKHGIETNVYVVLCSTFAVLPAFY